MSIYDEIANRVQEDLLFPIQPPNKGYEVRRKVFVTAGIYRKLETPPPGEENRINYFRADLVTFVSHEVVTPRQFWRLSDGHRHGVWELRSYEPEPQLRLLGHFAAKNTFIGLMLRYRDEFVEPTNWTADINSVNDIWRDLFPGNSPLTTSEPHRLFDGALDEQYFREN